jgi:hypothetical protein
LRNGQLPVKPAAALRWADYVHKLAAGQDGEARAAFERAEAIYRRIARNGPG